MEFTYIETGDRKQKTVRRHSYAGVAVQLIDVSIINRQVATATQTPFTHLRSLQGWRSGQKSSQFRV